VLFKKTGYTLGAHCTCLSGPETPEIYLSNIAAHTICTSKAVAAFIKLSTRKKGKQQ
jgi:hypothetical protein